MTEHEIKMELQALNAHFKIHISDRNLIYFSVS